MSRRDVKQVGALTSRGMTESEYQATIRAERMFGQIQVHQKFRALARELGLPGECSLPTEVSRRLPRWYADPQGFAQESNLRALRTFQAEARIGLAIMPPASNIRIASVA